MRRFQLVESGGVRDDTTPTDISSMISKSPENGQDDGV